MKPSSRSDIAPFHVMEVMRAAAAREDAGAEVLHLEVGQPSTAAPRGARAAAAAALERDTLGYTGTAGMPELRSAISRWYGDRYQLPVSEDRIIVTTGASGSFSLAFLALFDVGQRVAVLEPGYPCYRNDLLALGVDVVVASVGHENGFRPTIDQLHDLGPIDGLVIASPNNPTGTVLPPETLSAIVDWADARSVRLVVDEIYHGVSYGLPTPSALGYGDDVVVINSFSKFFSMTGWRLGWIVAPRNIAAAVERLSASFTIAPPTISQVAAIASFDCVEELEGNVERYRLNRDIVIEGLVEAGLDRMAPPDGAFYAWVDISKLGRDSQSLCQEWLEELGIATTPGIDFDQRRGHDFVRFSYAGAADEISEAMSRLKGWMANRSSGAGKAP